MDLKDEILRSDTDDTDFTDVEGKSNSRSLFSFCSSWTFYNPHNFLNQATK